MRRSSTRAMREMLPPPGRGFLDRPFEGSPLVGVTPIEGDVKIRGALLATVVAAVAAVWLAPLQDDAVASASACGSGAPRLEGLRLRRARVDPRPPAASGRRSRSFGRRASTAGHAAAWIGVGGPGAGPKGETMWLQAGLAALPKTPVDALRGDHADRATSPCSSPSARTSRRQRSPARRARDERATRCLACLARRSARHRPDRAGGLAPALEAHRTAETWNGGSADVQSLRVPLRPSRRRPGARRLVAAVRARLHVPRPRPRRPPAAPVPGGQRTLSTIRIEPYAFDAVSS